MNNLLSSCRQVSTKIIEDWAMMLVDNDIDAKDKFTPNELCFCATTNFQSNKGLFGSYSILCQSLFMDNLVSNLVSEGTPVTNECKLDALKELSNILAGNLTTSFFGNETTFDLSPPTSFEMPWELASVILQNNFTIAISVEGVPLAISFNSNTKDL
jgi:chemotaxis protein CheY-P-specific phosphatase CheC